jgi:hypothetical protein
MTRQGSENAVQKRTFEHKDEGYRTGSSPLLRNDLGFEPRPADRLMYMRDLACCAGGTAFDSTPSDLVRFALATNADGINMGPHEPSVAVDAGL